MKFETVKTIILSILVAISLLFTFGLWSFQPTNEVLDDEEGISDARTDIGGMEENTFEVIKPNAIYFHDNITDEHTSFHEPSDNMKLYNRMHAWELSEFENEEIDGVPDHDRQVEVRFPTSIPMDLINGMFDLKDDIELPAWSFQQIFIVLHPESSSVELQFPSTDNQRMVKATNHDEDTFQLLWGYLEDDDMSRLVKFPSPESRQKAVYLPESPEKMMQYSLTVDQTDPNKLVNSLFRKPSLVTTAGENLFTDGQQQMRLFHGGKSMEYLNPDSGSFEQMDVLNLIDLSVNNINDHKGWTNNFYLSDLSVTRNKVEFQMHYNDYPVFNRDSLSIIGQQWRNQELYEYRRPLFRLKDVLPDGQENEKSMKSSEKVIDLLTENESYDLGQISDIQVGYKLSYEDLAYNSVTLKPAWFMRYNSTWKEIEFADTMKKRSG